MLAVVDRGWTLRPVGPSNQTRLTWDGIHSAPQPHLLQLHLGAAGFLHKRIGLVNQLTVNSDWVCRETC